MESQDAHKFDAKVLSAKAILLDIEGTTTSKSFVKDTLFPFAAENVSSFLMSNWEDEAVQHVVAELCELANTDKAGCVEGFVEIIEGPKDTVINSLVNNVKWQMDLDRKNGPLKTLQGLVWQKGYESGALKGHVYEDVPEALSAWVNSGHRLYTYSSGSVVAQKLLFGHSEKGCLLDNFTGFFDTAAGNKQDVESYRFISKEIGSESILFLTDVVKEAAAAVGAGLSAVLLKRDADTTFTEEDTLKYSVITSFKELPLKAVSGKRKPLDDTENESPPTKLAKTSENTEEKYALEKPTEVVENSINKTTENKTDVTDNEVLEKLEKIDVPEESNETEALKESHEFDAMEVDSSDSNLKHDDIHVLKANEAAIKEEDSTQRDIVAADDAKLDVDATEEGAEKLEKSEEQSDAEQKGESIQEEQGKLKEGILTKLVKEEIAEVLKEEAVRNCEIAAKAEQVEESVNDLDKNPESNICNDKDDSKLESQLDNALKESNVIESNGTGDVKDDDEVAAESNKMDCNDLNGCTSGKLPTNGTDSDKENDKEVVEKSELTVNGSANGIIEESVQEVKVKKIQPEISASPLMEETA